ncbi:unnamed protein product [Rotaria magnacalcarata]|uniref:Ricin B lectin domain-containing protein n=1 Tax=Rotaria magnacalcarata TaxID=392030 RepID=A0A819HLA8_9BILA|nr:unnamed protein product [Rotaria magnacalcarata]
MNTLEKEIFTLINNHRQQHGLPALQPSVNLAYVAHTHAMDVVENNPDVNGGNMHSWSDKGKWKPVTYTSDHRYASLMWSKPSEISNYKFNGFEISFGYGKNVRKTMTLDPNRVVESWKNSPGHNDVMVQSGGFSHMPMKAMGAGVYKGYACVWFGHELDTYSAPNGTPKGKEPNEFSGNYQLLNVQSNKVLDIYGKGTDDGTNVQIFVNHGGENQIWVIHANQDGTVKLINPHSGKVLDVYGSGTSDGTNVQIFTDNGSNAQKWHVQGIEGGKYKLINVGSSKALDVTSSGTSDGTNVQMWSDNALIQQSQLSVQLQQHIHHSASSQHSPRRPPRSTRSSLETISSIPLLMNHQQNCSEVRPLMEQQTTPVTSTPRRPASDSFDNSDSIRQRMKKPLRINDHPPRNEQVEQHQLHTLAPPHHHQHSFNMNVLKRAVSSNLPCFFIIFDASVESNNIPSSIQLAIVLKKCFAQNQIPIKELSMCVQAGERRFKFAVDKKAEFIKPRTLSDCFDSAVRYVPLDINQNIAQQQILKTIPATVGFSSILYHHCQRATYDIRFTVRSLEPYQTALELGRLSIGHSRTLKISHRKLL